MAEVSPITSIPSTFIFPRYAFEHLECQPIIALACIAPTPPIAPRLAATLPYNHELYGDYIRI